MEPAEEPAQGGREARGFGHWVVDQGEAREPAVRDGPRLGIGEDGLRNRQRGDSGHRS